MTPWLSALISMVFLAAGAVAVYLMLRLQGRGDSDRARQLARLHRLSGRLFAILFLLMFFFMLARVEDYWEESSPRIAIHVALALGLFFLITLKVLISRYYQKLAKHLFSIGISVYLAAFTMVWITAGYYFIWRYQEAPYITHGELPAHMRDAEIGKQLFINKCSTCHMLENIMRVRSAEAWEETVNRMVEIASPRIAPGEGAQILHYLSQTHVPEPPAAGEDASPLQRYCLPCHKRADIRDRSYSRTGWQEVVEEMRGYGPDIIPRGKTGEIVDYLIDLQSPGD